jgi:hypothetical protein
MTKNSDGGVESRNTRSVSLADGSQSSGSTLGLADLAGVAPGPSEALSDMTKNRKSKA